MSTLGHLRLWIDPAKRTGPENMAVDQWLLENVEQPVLRTYRWSGDWVSIGYFGKIEEAREHFPGVNIVRRWTGGGIVDHRNDWTYTLIVPKSEALANLPGGGSYGIIHRALAAALAEEGIQVRCSAGNDQTGANLCFANPVRDDLVSDGGAKLAGAGQRRTRWGLLHQGSVASSRGDDELFEKRSRLLAAGLAAGFDFWQPDIESDRTRFLVQSRYSSDPWNLRR